MTEQTYTYNKIFAPPPPDALRRDEGLRGGDRPEEGPYVYTEDIALAVNVALAAERPLLVAGPPGSGKSSLAGNLSRQLHRRLLPKVITARTEARDLLWRFDAVARLRDAQVQKDAPESVAPEQYVHAGVLWEAFDASRKDEDVVVLIDEIDKADPDLPNSLLETLGNGRFSVDDLPDWEPITLNREHAPLIVITTNNERELPRPFIRRCVTIKLPAPDKDRLLAIAASWGLADEGDQELADLLADEVIALAQAGDGRPAEAAPSAAEYLDALRACLQLGIRPGSSEWNVVCGATLIKRIDDGG
jgi:MoxR-like ATPase